jgi:GT2 family glycosyltransferase
VLNYNGGKDLPSLFNALNVQSIAEFEIVFVDNASSDNSLAIAREQCTKLRSGISVRIIENSENYGYCKGNNIGASYACKTSDYLVFLNNDALVGLNWLLNLVYTAKRNNSVGAIGSKMVESLPVDNSNDKPAESIFTCDIYGQTEGLTLRASDYNHSVPSFYCSGASLLIPRNIFNKVGGFDDALFMYNDELDLCWRIRLAGYDILTANDSLCFHKRNLSTNGLKLPVWKFYHGVSKNRLRVLIKNYSSKNLLKTLPLAISLVILRGLLSAIKNQNVDYIIVTFEGLFWNLKEFEKYSFKKSGN